MDRPFVLISGLIMFCLMMLFPLRIFRDLRNSEKQRYKDNNKMIADCRASRLKLFDKPNDRVNPPTNGLATNLERG